MPPSLLDQSPLPEVPAYTRADVRLSSTVGSLRFNCDLINALDRKLISTGFPDPSGTDAAYYYPAARRALQIGIGSAW